MSSSASSASLQLMLLNILVLSYISTYCADSILARIVNGWILLSSILAFLVSYPSYFSPSTCFRGLTTGL
ncbi:uncharacterized protein H6S33_000594 [Morchella sextelata]|uniref:Uncharacterized protein n=1 Tax=Morchella conica CCBAS932 TaxID=1392247 RepID=A0A3N4L272_9PEZI|nr:uncharacterized protein H6S33_000594 [Morchella sextelata]KAH0614958.1 hypothetical protein H6S33_000594 [Morchella sextelata]RPB16914.1 hypothetical protein P167DRAFT_531857 [Morchella conica CCBAS932]